MDNDGHGPSQAIKMTGVHDVLELMNHTSCHFIVHHSKHHGHLSFTVPPASWVVYDYLGRRDSLAATHVSADSAASSFYC